VTDHVLAALLACALAPVAALRSTWSPCGLSMLSTLTPLAERGRGRRFASTAACFIAGATAGGATLGLGAAGLAFAIGRADLSGTTTLLIAAAGTAAALGIELSLLPPHLPHHRRQVNETWLNRYRSWVYGSGFGYQIGIGVATYIMTAAVYLIVGLAGLSANPAAALLVCTGFGFLRGTAVLAGAGITNPGRLVAFHTRFDRWREPVRRFAVASQAGVLAIIVVALGGIAAAAGVVIVVAVTLRFAARGRLNPAQLSP
jgi:MFS family permease